MNGLILVETRRLDFDPIEKHLPFLKGFEPLVFCSEYNISQYRGKYNTVKVTVNSLDQYNQLLTSYDFWKQIPYEKVLICQHDSGLLRTGIEFFYEWDYVGAPWWFQKYGANGGLSLRTVKAMQDITKHYTWTGGNEDIFFSNIIHNSNVFKLAPPETCKLFAVETVFSMGSLGYHAINKHLSDTQVNKILNQYNNYHRYDEKVAERG